MSDPTPSADTPSAEPSRASRCTHDGRCGHRRSRGRRFFRFLLFLGAVGGAAFFIPRAFAGGGWGGHGCHSEPATAADLRERAGWGAEHLMDAVDADDAQRAALEGVLDGAVPEAFAFRQEGRALHEDLAEALGGPTVDRARLEELRLDGLDLADRASARAMDWVAEAASILRPEQRATLKDTWESHRR